jgi:hypothetical protein
LVLVPLIVALAALSSIAGNGHCCTRPCVERPALVVT